MSKESKHEPDPEFAWHVIKHIDDGLAITDVKGRLLYVNPALEQITGYHCDEMTGRLFSEFVQEKYHETVKRTFEQINKENNPVYEVGLISKTGPPVDVCLRTSGVRVSGVYKGAVFIIRNVADTREKKAELRKALSEAKAAKKERKKFLASMSHEIRTPMTGILGMAQMLLQTDLDEEQQNYLESIEISARNLTKILNDILDYSRLDADKSPLNESLFRIGKSVRQICNNFMIQAGEKGIDLSVHIEDSLPEKVVGDEDRYLQALMQILANACKFTEEGFVKITVSGNSVNGDRIDVKTVVEDSGDGIPGEIRNSLFESFSKASRNTMSTHGGTGLGLAIVKKLVDLMNGSVSVADRDGKGTIITMDIPFKLKSHEDDTVEAADSRIKSDKKLLEGRIILVADDHPVNQKLLVSMLGKAGGKVLTAASGDEALDVYRNHPEVDLILMDIHMPGMNGLEAAKKIRSDFGPDQSDVAILAVTASVMSSDVDKIKEAGMNDFIAKPFTLKELTDKVEKFLESDNQKKSKTGVKKQVSETAWRMIDLQSLYEITSGDEDVMLDMMDLFLEQTPALLDNLVSAFSQSEWQKMGEAAHKLKPTYSYMGIKKAYDITSSLEVYRDGGKIKGKKSVETLVTRLIDLTSDAFQEIESAASEIRNKIS